MATSSVTYTYVDGGTIEAAEHNQNFADLVGFLNSNVVHTDGSKSLTGGFSVDSLTATGAGSFGGAVSVGAGLSVVGDITSAAAGNPTFTVGNDSGEKIHFDNADGEIRIDLNDNTKVKVEANDLVLRGIDIVAPVADQSFFTVGNDSGESIAFDQDNNRVRFNVTGNTVGYLTSSEAYFTGVYDTTTASSANVFVGASGPLQRSTSSARAKSRIEDLSPDRKSAAVGLRPRYFRSDLPADEGRSFYGFIAEEVAAVDPRLAAYDPDGNPSGLNTDGILAMAVDMVLDLRSEVAGLRRRVTELEGAAGNRPAPRDRGV